MRTIEELLRWGSDALRPVTPIPRKEAEILLSFALDMPRLSLHIYPDKKIDSPLYEASIARRVAFEPVEYITQSVSFYGEMFYCAKGALIPRPETELLIDHFLAMIAPLSSPTIVEVGVGSGAMSVMLAKLRPDAKIIGCDISPDALRIAQVNCERFGVGDRVTLCQSDLLTHIDVPIDAVISNPPYIANDVPLPQSLDYEPSLALFGGDVGDELLKKLVIACEERHIAYLGCEMGYDQKKSMGEYLTHRGWSSTFYCDYGGLDRGFCATREVFIRS